MAVGGYFAAVGSALCNGSFGTISKFDRVQKAAIPFPIFAFWNTVGIVISSIFFLAATPRVTPLPLLPLLALTACICSNNSSVFYFLMFTPITVFQPQYSPSLPGLHGHSEASVSFRVACYIQFQNKLHD